MPQDDMDGVIDEFAEHYAPPKPANFEDYQGMSRDSEIDYQKRQNEPLFKKAQDMIPMEQVKQHFENLKCGHKGCNGIVRDKIFYACIIHQALQAVGTDFTMYYNLINDNELERASSEQIRRLEKRRVYMQRWLDNFPMGATQ